LTGPGVGETSAVGVELASAVELVSAVGVTSAVGLALGDGATADEGEAVGDGSSLGSADGLAVGRGHGSTAVRVMPPLYAGPRRVDESPVVGRVQAGDAEGRFSCAAPGEPRKRTVILYSKLLCRRPLS
jgi:hypothetical protein